MSHKKAHYRDDQSAIESSDALDLETYLERTSDDGDDYEELVALREEIGDDLLEVTGNVDDELPQFISPHHTFKDGTIVKLRGVSALAVDNLQTIEVGKPQAPLKLTGKHRPEPPEKIRKDEKTGEDIVDKDGNAQSYVDYEDKEYLRRYKTWLDDRNIKKRMLPDENDEQYLIELAEWKQSRERKLIRYLAIKGVDDLPPYDWMREAESYLPDNYSDNDAKYMWIAEKLEDEQEIQRFYTAIAGLTMATADGIEQSKKDTP